MHVREKKGGSALFTKLLVRPGSINHALRAPDESRSVMQISSPYDSIVLVRSMRSRIVSRMVVCILIWCWGPRGGASSVAVAKARRRSWRASPSLALPIADWGSLRSFATIDHRTFRPRLGQTHCYHQKIRRRHNDPPRENNFLEPLQLRQTRRPGWRWYTASGHCTFKVLWHAWVHDTLPHGSVVCMRQPAPVSGITLFSVVGFAGKKGGRKQGGKKKGRTFS